MRTVDELNKDEFQELKTSYFYQLFETDKDVLNGIEYAEEIPDDIIKNHYSGISFVEEDFFCNLNKDDNTDQTEQITITVENANNVVNFWERNKDDSGIFVEFIDFKKIKISFDEDIFNGDLEDAMENVKSVIYNSSL